MAYRKPQAAPSSSVALDRRGEVVGRFCRVCSEFYPLHRARHAGKPMYGKDHVAAPCAHQGEEFAPGSAWWEPAVEVLAPPAVAPPPAAPPS
jgi:hypothetical protein